MCWNRILNRCNHEWGWSMNTYTYACVKIRSLNEVTTNEDGPGQLWPGPSTVGYPSSCVGNSNHNWGWSKLLSTKRIHIHDCIDWGSYFEGDGKAFEYSRGQYRLERSSIAITTNWGSYFEGLESWLHRLRILMSITTL